MSMLPVSIGSILTEEAEFGDEDSHRKRVSCWMIAMEVSDTQGCAFCQARQRFCATGSRLAANGGHTGQ